MFSFYVESCATRNFIFAEFSRDLELKTNVYTLYWKTLFRPVPNISSSHKCHLCHTCEMHCFKKDTIFQKNVLAGVDFNKKKLCFNSNFINTETLEFEIWHSWYRITTESVRNKNIFLFKVFLFSEKHYIIITYSIKKNRVGSCLKMESVGNIVRMFGKACEKTLIAVSYKCYW